MAAGPITITSSTWGTQSGAACITEYGCKGVAEIRTGPSLLVGCDEAQL